MLIRVENTLIFILYNEILNMFCYSSVTHLEKLASSYPLGYYFLGGI